MRIVIDLQGAQTDSRYHGIGRYSRAFALALAHNPGDHEIWLLLNGAYPEAALDLRRAFADVVPDERILTFHPPIPLELQTGSRRPRRNSAELIRAHVLQSVDPDCVLITSVIEPLGTDAVTTNTLPELDAITVAIVYDLIPMLRPEQYLSDDDVRAFYTAKVAALGRARLLLAISESSRREAIEHIPAHAERVVNVSSAASAAFSPAALSQGASAASDLAAHGITDRFLMYAPSGYDPRKNIEGLIEAFGQLPAPIRRTRQLVITSKFAPYEEELLRTVARKAGLASGDLVLTGYVSDAELIALYRATDLFVYPSLHEGFGLPVLEAMACGAPVIGSDRTSIPEIIGSADALFDPTSPTAIAAKIVAALGDPAWLAARREEGIAQASRFSWERSVQRALVAMEEAFAPATTDAKVPGETKLQLALVTPLPPQRTGIAAHVAGILPELAERFDITLVSEAPAVALTGSAGRLRVHGPEWFRAHADEFDHVMYQVGNSEFHTFMIPLLRAVPGVVVLHDFFLGGLFWSAQRAGLPNAWNHALRDSHSDVVSRVHDDGELLRRFPANRSVLNSARSVIVHSRHARDLIDHWYGPSAGLDVHVIPLARRAPARHDRAKARESLGIAEDSVLTCSFGQVDASKCNVEVVHAWLNSAVTTDPRHHLHLVGPWPSPEYAKQVRALAEAHPHGERVSLIGWASEDVYSKYLAATDVAVQLRSGSRGETSAAVLDCLNHGIPTVVNAHGSAAELPDAVVRRVDDEFAVADLTQALNELLTDGVMRSQLGSAARALMAEQFSPAAAAAAYESVIRQSARRPGRHHGDLLRDLRRETSRDMTLRSDVAQSVARSLRLPATPRQVLVDVTHDQTSWTAAQADDLVLTAPADLRVRFVRAADTAQGFQLMNVDGYPAGHSDYLTDLRCGDVLVVSKVENLQNPGIRAAYLAAEAAGVGLTIVDQPGPSAVADLIQRMRR